MNQNFVKFNTLAILSMFVVSCSDNNQTVNNSNSEIENQEKATLNLVANGEDFVRQGFITKDGWQINFDRLEVNLSNVTTYQTEGAVDVMSVENIEALEAQQKVVLLDTPQVVDLAQGDSDAEPIMVTNQTVDAGFYNAVAWQIETGEENSPLADQTMQLQGTAEKNGQIINFELAFNQPTSYLCGEYVGDERKGIVEAGDTGEVELTFHFDHIFGDSETSADDALNQDALGFEPLAKLASGDRLNVDYDSLLQQLSPQEREKLTAALIDLGHVGEGHCQILP